MTAVIASLVVAQFVYVHAIGVTWIGMLNFLGVFIVLGVGAGDVFVILEFWKQSKRGALDSRRGRRSPLRRWGVVHRARARRALRWTAEKSLYVVTMTSVTTAAAFACNMASRIAPVRLFGAFMAALIAGNYLLVCTTFPALLVLEHGDARRRSARGGGDGKNRARVRATRLESVVVAPAHR